MISLDGDEYLFEIAEERLRRACHGGADAAIALGDLVRLLRAGGHILDGWKPAASAPLVAGQVAAALAGLRDLCNRARALLYQGKQQQLRLLTAKQREADPKLRDLIVAAAGLRHQLESVAAIEVETGHELAARDLAAVKQLAVELAGEHRVAGELVAELDLVFAPVAPAVGDALDLGLDVPDVSPARLLECLELRRLWWTNLVAAGEIRETARRFADAPSPTGPAGLDPDLVALLARMPLPPPPAFATEGFGACVLEGLAESQEPYDEGERVPDPLGGGLSRLAQGRAAIEYRIEPGRAPSGELEPDRLPAGAREAAIAALDDLAAEVARADGLVARLSPERAHPAAVRFLRSMKHWILDMRAALGDNPLLVEDLLGLMTAPGTEPGLDDLKLALAQLPASHAAERALLAHSARSFARRTSAAENARRTRRVVCLGREKSISAWLTGTPEDAAEFASTTDLRDWFEAGASLRINYERELHGYLVKLEGVRGRVRLRFLSAAGDELHVAERRSAADSACLPRELMAAVATIELALLSRQTTD